MRAPITQARVSLRRWRGHRRGRSARRGRRAVKAPAVYQEETAAASASRQKFTRQLVPAQAPRGPRATPGDAPRRPALDARDGDAPVRGGVVMGRRSLIIEAHVEASAQGIGDELVIGGSSGPGRGKMSKASSGDGRIALGEGRGDRPVWVGELGGNIEVRGIVANEDGSGRAPASGHSGRRSRWLRPSSHSQGARVPSMVGGVAARGR